MKKLALLTVLAGTVLAIPAPAQAQTTYLLQDDNRCGFVTTTDPTWSSVQTGEMHGGPLDASVEGLGGLGATISMKCTIQVGVSNSSHWGTDAATVSSGASVQVATLPPTLVSYWQPSQGTSVYLCTEASVHGVTYYWDSSFSDWTQNGSAWCDEVISQEQVWVTPQCRDGQDNDLDGLYDTSDPDCASPDDPVEAGVPAVTPQCRDGQDNDSDGLYDTYDPDCESPDDPVEAPVPNLLAPQCSDRLDNDGDDATDYPNDPDCVDASDPTEGPEPGPDPCPPPAPGVVVCLTPGGVVFEQPVQLVAVTAGTPHTVNGYVYAYHFEVAPDTRVSVPCVVLILDGVERDPCLEAGGERKELVFTLGPQTVNEPAVAPGGTVATVRVCNATLRATVGPFGVPSASAFALC